MNSAGTTAKSYTNHIHYYMICIDFSDCPDGNGAGCFIDWARAVAHTDERAVAEIVDAGVSKFFKSLNHCGLWISRFFNFDGEERSVLFNQQIDFQIIVVAHIKKLRFVPVMPMRFKNFHNDKSFKDRSRHCAVRERFWGVPRAEKRAQSRIAKIKFWSFDEPFCYIFVVGLEQIGDSRSAENRNPFFCGDRRDVGIACEFRIIQRLRRSCRRDFQKTEKCEFVSDLRKLPHVSFDVGAQITFVKNAPGSRRAQSDLRERAAPNGFKNFGRTNGRCRSFKVGLGNKRLLRFPVPDGFGVRKSHQIENGNSSRKTFCDLSHHLELLRTSQPDSAARLRIVGEQFEIGENLWRILHLVDNNRKFVELEKKFRLLACQTALFGIVKRNIIATRFCKIFEKRGFPDLPRACNQDDFKVFCGVDNRFLQCSWVNHLYTNHIHHYTNCKDFSSKSYTNHIHHYMNCIDFLRGNAEKTGRNFLILTNCQEKTIYENRNFDISLCA